VKRVYDPGAFPGVKKNLKKERKDQQ